MSGTGTFFAKVLSRFQSSRTAAASSAGPEPDRPLAAASAAPALEAAESAGSTETVSTMASPMPAEAIGDADLLPLTAPEEPEEPSVSSAAAAAPPAAVRTRSAVAAARPRSMGGRGTASRALTASDAAAAAIAPPGPSAPAIGPGTAADPAREAVLRSLEEDLLKLCSLTASTLVRAKRTPAISGAAVRRPGSLTTATTAAAPTGDDAANGDPGEAAAAAPGKKAGTPPAAQGPLEAGIEMAQAVEQRARGLLLDHSLTRPQHERIERSLQSVLDLVCALRASRYAWQITHLLHQEGPEGRAVLPRLRRVVEHTIEMSDRVTFAMEGREGAATAVAEHYRTFLQLKTEGTIHVAAAGGDNQTARHLAYAGLTSLTVAAESMAKVAARFALPLGSAADRARHQDIYRHQDRGDDLLAPLPRR